MRPSSAAPAVAVALVLAAALLAGAVSPPLAAQDAIRPGERVEGRLTAADTAVTPGQLARLVRLDAPPGARLTISLESADFDAYVALVTTGGGGVERVAENDDAPGLAAGTDARVRGWIGEGAEYAVWVGSYDGTGTGDFVLRVEGAPPGEVFPVPLGYGEEVEGVLGGDDPVDDAGRPYRVFEVEVWGLQRIMALARGEASPTLRITRAGSRTALAAANPSEDGRTFLDGTVQQPGAYQVVVTASDAAGGPFRLRVWSPSVTQAELAGLALRDSTLRHEALGFEVPWPGDDYAFSRLVPAPHSRDGLGDYRIWTLANLDGTGHVMILWYTMHGPLDQATFENSASQLARQVASNMAPDTPLRGKPVAEGVMDYRAALRPVEGGVGAAIRCLGKPGTGEGRGKLLCVSLLVDGSDPGIESLLDGMVLR